MADIEFKLDTREVSAALARLAQRLPQAVASALYEEAEIEKEESMRRTPVDTGALKGSHRVSDPDVTGEDISVTISVGGAAAPYAVYVHEDEEAFHEVGQAKFLESTVLESIPHMADRIAKRINVQELAK